VPRKVFQQALEVCELLVLRHSLIVWDGVQRGVRATPTLSSQCLKKVLNLTSMDERTQLDVVRAISPPAHND